MSEWTADQFGRRKYTVEGDGLDKAKRISVTIHVDGKKFAELQVREPGLLAIVSRPDMQGIDIEIIEPGGARFVDQVTPSGGTTSALTPWQKEALGV